MATKLKFWKEAATLIIAARTKSPVINHLGNKKLTFDYRILMLQRNAKSRFFPSGQVFPGGRIDRADLSPAWLGIFKKYGNVRKTEDFGKMVNIQGPRPPMLVGNQSEVPIDVAFRICAIRETFEESGILLLRRSSDNPDIRDHVPLGSYVTLSDEEVQRWRKAVYKDPEQFLTLCNELQSFPDIWSLAEWSNWLTPSAITKRRYDTMFYISCLDSMPHAMEDESEIVQSKWVTPLESLQMNVDGETRLPPPQLYEFRRLLRFEKFDTLLEFSRERAFKGTIRYLPVRCYVDDGLVSLLPGDEDYPRHPQMKTGKDACLQTNESADDFTRGKVTNRIIFRSAVDYDLSQTAQPACGHVLPSAEKIRPSKPKSKL